MMLTYCAVSKHREDVSVHVGLVNDWLGRLASGACLAGTGLVSLQYTRLTHRADTTQSQHDIEPTPHRADTIQSQHHTEQTPHRADTIQSQHHTEPTPHRANSTQSQHHTEPTSHRANTTQSQHHTEPTPHRANTTQSQQHTEPTAHRANTTQSQHHTEPTAHRANTTQSQHHTTITANMTYRIVTLFLQIFRRDLIQLVEDGCDHGETGLVLRGQHFLAHRQNDRLAVTAHQEEINELTLKKQNSSCIMKVIMKVITQRTSRLIS